MAASAPGRSSSSISRSFIAAGAASAEVLAARHELGHFEIVEPSRRGPHDLALPPRGARDARLVVGLVEDRGRL